MMKFRAGKTWFSIVSILGLILVFFVAPPASMANGNGVLGPSFNYTLRGDVVAAGVGLRGAGAGEIVLSDIPGGASVFKAYLYWATLGSANTFTSPTLEGQPVNGDLIGTSGDTCWGIQHNFVYRADVTSLVPGNGSYTIAGLPNSLQNGNDSQGASLVVIYQDDGAPLRTVAINDGAVSLDFVMQTYTNTIQGFTPDSPVTDAHITYLVGDGQAMWEAGNVTFNETPIASGIFSGVDGQYWGTHTFDVTALVAGAPVTSAINNNDPGNPTSPDCLLWAASIFSVTAQMPAEVGNNLSEFLNLSTFGDVAVAGTGLRGTGQGDINVTSIPAGSRVLRAFLYWATIGNSGQFTSPQLEEQAVEGELIGVSADTCWGALHNYVYRAEVTGLVSGNGVYTISGLPNSLAAGNDSQGAALVIIYPTNINQPFRTMIINEGAVTLDFDVHSFTDTLTGFTPDEPLTEARVVYIVGDGQERWETGNVTFNGTSIASNVFTGVDGNYWGTLSFDVTALVTGSPATTTINNNNPNNPLSPDCLLWAATVFSVSSPGPVLDNFLYMPFVPFSAE